MEQMKCLLRPDFSILLDVDVLVRLEGPHGVIGELDTVVSRY